MNLNRDMTNRRLNVAQVGWPLADLGAGMDTLARRTGLDAASGEPLRMPASSRMAGEELSRWVQWAGRKLALEAEPIQVTVADFDKVARAASPAILQLDSDRGPLFLLLMGSSKRRVKLLGPDLKTHRCSLWDLKDALMRRHEQPLREEIDRVLDLAALDTDERPRVRAALIAQRLSDKPIAACWMLRTTPTSNFWKQLVHARLPVRLTAMLAVFAAIYGLEIFGWGLIGEAALSGRLDLGWMSAWILLLFTLVPLGLLGGWLNSTLALDVGRILKRRLMAGALRIGLDKMRHQGAGQLLSRVMESQALDALALNGGLSVIVALVELAFSAWVLGIGAGGILHLGSLAIWLLVTLALGWSYVRRMQAWTFMRLEMTHGLIERMVGHRTLLAQEWPNRRDAQDDQTVQDYVRLSHRMDVAGVRLFAGVPGGWGLVGLAGLAPAFVSGSATPASIAIAFGGLLLSTRAFGGIASGMSSLASALIAWTQAAPMFRAGAYTGKEPPFLTADQVAHTTQDGTTANVVDALDLVFRHGPQGKPVLDGTDLTIAHGERVLLEGPSGGGKSSLASLLVGLRRPDAGLLLLNGLDRHTLGTQWQRVATEAPQFHENHVFGGTLGFNLLMGRNWPAEEHELAAAQSLCEDLGLGDLIARMPSGMMQMVGETGWQLSHGERSRLFLARALMQDAQLTIMDESFAALDPETLKQCLNCVFARARTLMVIAHP